MKIEATKVNGTQNHFLILCSNNKNLHNKEVIQKLIAQTDFERIDGAIILSDKENLDFKMDYYNNDGWYIKWRRRFAINCSFSS